MVSCSCQSSLPYEACCRPFHMGELPPTALQLMRSRYSAYVLRLWDYLMATTHKAHPEYQKDRAAWAKKLQESSAGVQFASLTILQDEESAHSAEVTFVVEYSYNGAKHLFKEKSLFTKVQGRWFYRASIFTERS